MEQADDAAGWFEDDAFWATFYSFMFPQERFDAAVEEVPGLLALSGLRRGSVLDLCCGPGRYAVPLAKRGFAVTGVDRTAPLLDRARAYAEAEGVSVEWVREDMRRFVRPDAFDLAVNLLTSFGYFDDPDENRSVLRCVFESLKPGGVFVVDLMGKEIIAALFEPTGSTELADGSLVVQRRTPIDGWSRMENEWIFIRDDVARSFRLRHWMYSGYELKTMLAGVGFSEVELYGDFDGAAYGPGARRLIAVARKER